MKEKTNILTKFFILTSAILVLLEIYFVANLEGEIIYDYYLITVFIWMIIFAFFLSLSFFKTNKKQNIKVILFTSIITIVAFFICLQFLPFIPMEPRTPFEH